MKPKHSLPFFVLFLFFQASQAQTWKLHIIRNAIPGAWSRAGDFDKDGDPDILVQAGDSILWYENLRPGWQPHLIDASFYNSDYSWVDVLDLDSDGDLDVLKAPITQNGVDSLSWNENQSNGSQWVKHHLMEIHGLIGWMNGSYGDLDGDGDMDIVVPVAGGGGPAQDGDLIWLRNEGNTGNWSEITIKADHTRWSSIGDMDGDGDMDVVCSGNRFGPSGSTSEIMWLENTLPNSSWSIHTVRAPSDYIGKIEDLNGDGKLDVISTYNFIYTGIAYYANSGWQETIIDTTADFIPGVTGDIDGDGDMDLTYGFAGTNLWAGLEGLNWAENTNNGASWINHEITRPGKYQMLSTGFEDIDGDGDKDLIGYRFDLDPSVLVGAVFWAENPFGVTGLDDLNAPDGISPLLIWPNPTSGLTHIRCNLSSPGWVNVTVYNLLGKRVASLAEGLYPDGENTWIWNGKMDRDTPVPGGVYWVKVKTEKGEAVGKILLE